MCSPRPLLPPQVKKALEERYSMSLKTGKNKWFFQKLRF
jgi:hypothetical protein